MNTLGTSCAMGIISLSQKKEKVHSADSEAEQTASPTFPFFLPLSLRAYTEKNA